METEIRCLSHWGEGYTSHLIQAVGLATCFTALPSHLLVCITVLKDVHKTLKFPFMLLVLNANIAGLVIAVITAPLSFALTFMADKPLSTTAVAMAELRNVSFYISSTVCLITCICLCVDRYLAVSAPVWYKASSSSGRLVLASGFIWIIGAGLPVTCLTIGFQKYGFINANITLIGVLSFVIFTLITFHWDWDETEVCNVPESDRRDPSHTVLHRLFCYLIGLYFLCFVPASVMMYIAFLTESISCGAKQYLEEIHFMLILTYSSALPYVCIAFVPQLRREMLSVVKCVYDPRVRPQQSSNGEEWNMTLK